MKAFYLLTLMIFSFFPTKPVFSLSFKDFDSYQNRFTQDELMFRLNHYLLKDKTLYDQYLKIDSEALSLYSSFHHKQQNLPEYVLKLTSSTSSDQKKPSKHLKGLKIAIDPGHFGGDQALLEQRWIQMPANALFVGSPSISFNEGTLTLLTAKLLKALLEKEGAHVLLTKETNGQGVYPEQFSDWIDQFVPPKPLSQSEIFRAYYNPLDLHARVQKINAFQPDLTIIIHYNAHLDRDPISQNNVPAHHNYNMVFVGGSFTRDELSSVESRYALLRLLLTTDLDQSIALSQAVLSQFTQHLHVEPVKEENSVKYLDKACLKLSEGVYARNLVLTRLIHGPICYGESLCQDDVEECQKLNAEHDILDGLRGPNRVKQVAQAYFEGIKNYLSSLQSSN